MSESQQTDAAQPFTPFTFEGDESLKVHIRSADGSPAHELVLFVHGLQGRGYETWGEFPRLLLEDPSLNVDVGVFQYASGRFRFLNNQSAKLEHVEIQLADEIRRLKYPRITIFAHSMGGLLSLGALKDLHMSHSKPTGQFAILLFAVPQAGSRRVPAIAFTKDAVYLKAHSRFSTAIEQYITEHFNTRIDTPDNLRSRLPIYAASGTRDFWVDPFSSSVGIPRIQRITIPGNHTSLVKPLRSDARIYTWAVNMLAETEKVFASDARRASLSASVSINAIIAEFNYSPLLSACFDAYIRAKQEIFDATGVQVLDSVQASGRQSDILMRIVRAQDVDENDTRAELQSDNQRQIENPEIYLGLAAHGELADHARERIFTHVGKQPGGAARWIEGIVTITELKNLIANWLNQVHTNHSVSRRYAKSQLTQMDEMIDREESYGRHDEGFGRSDLYGGRF